MQRTNLFISNRKISHFTDERSFSESSIVNCFERRSSERLVIIMKEIKIMEQADRLAIANRIVDLRKESGYKSKEIAQQMDIGATTYSDIECANTKLSVDNLYKLCQVFDVSADYIIFGETEDSYLAEVRKIFKQRPGMAKKIVAGLREMFG